MPGSRPILRAPLPSRTRCIGKRGLWAYGTLATVSVTTAQGATLGYIQGDRSLATHSCRTCGCTTHWLSLTDDGPATRIAVNMRMADPGDWAGIRVRHFDGADTWEFLD